MKKMTKAEANFKPHMMYDKKSGKGVRAGTFKKHLDLKKKGYGHTKPKAKKKMMAGGMAKKKMMAGGMAKKKMMAGGMAKKKMYGGGMARKRK
ncbi:MAG: hypothetical protein Tp1100SUR639781_15 [Prokaryotic dsDNA virus sp.]|jgi:hypothetical protein|nr:MAG: hypothetical protein Tp1100SUR639781_15 [Prokaryotic dsDNA virus sp.]|tara:strand:- start:19813 stop:20091 length:279 start_codon:yes stop_codon:yes gene_type:complete